MSAVLLNFVSSSADVGRQMRFVLFRIGKGIVSHEKECCFASERLLFRLTKACLLPLCYRLFAQRFLKIMAFCLAVPIKIRIFADRNQIKLTKNERLSMFGLGMNEVLLIALVVLLLFGGKKIPELMKGLGKGVKSFKEGMKEIESGGDESGKDK